MPTHVAPPCPARVSSSAHSTNLTKSEKARGSGCTMNVISQRRSRPAGNKNKNLPVRINKTRPPQCCGKLRFIPSRICNCCFLQRIKRKGRPRTSSSSLNATEHIQTTRPPFSAHSALLHSSLNQQLFPLSPTSS